MPTISIYITDDTYDKIVKEGYDVKEFVKDAVKKKLEGK